MWSPERERDQRGISDNVQSDKRMKTTVQYNNILSMFSTGRLSSEVNTQYRGAPPSVLLTAKPIIAPDNLGKKDT